MRVSIGRFEELSDGNPASLLELIELYVTKTEEQITAVKHAIDSQSKSDLVRLAHSMTGANLMVGMGELVALLKKVENSGQAGEFQNAAVFFEEFCVSFKKAELQLKKVGNHLQNL